MATQRYISTSFYDDSWVRRLTILQKFVYMYLMTNALTNIAGVYKTTLDRIVFDIGAPESEVKEALERFQKDGKAFFFEDYVIIPSWPKHQKWDRRTKIKTGIDNVLESLPPKVIGFMAKIGYCYDLSKLPGYPMDKVSIPYTYEPNYYDSKTETDLETETEVEYTLSGKPDDSFPFQEIFDHLNKVTGKGYRGVEAHKRLIRARMNEGHTLEDFKSVIDFKFAQWKDNEEMVGYARPDTLFAASHFDSYLQEARAVTPVAPEQKPRGSAQFDELLNFRRGIVKNG